MSKVSKRQNNSLTGRFMVFLVKAMVSGKYLIDIILIIASYWVSYFVRFEGAIPLAEMIIFKKTLFVFVSSFLICNFLFGLAKSIWRYASLRDIERIGSFVLAGNGLCMLTGFIFLYESMVKIPRSIYLLNSIFLFLSMSAVRLFYRIVLDRLKRASKRKENVLIIGDQDMAASLQYTILKDHSHQFRIVGFISANRRRIGSTINAISIIGCFEDILPIAQRNDIKYIFIAVEAASNKEMKKIIKLAQQTEASVRMVPTILDVVDGKFSLRDLREIRFEDYLDRKPVGFDMDKIRSEFYQKTILVTGGGGSIGSSICRELVKLKPAKLIVSDIAEDNLFRVSRDLNDMCRQRHIEGIDVLYKLVDVKDKPCLEKIFQNFSIDYLIHAAAKKHVFFSETNSLEAIATNIYGTFNLLSLSRDYKIKKVVYISTDKAVEPISVMGATKRVGEFLIKLMSKKESVSTKFIAVRFGNVIGSSGNVVEIFTQQLQKGEPLTITDPKMERYFMSLNEATKLILQAISLGQGGEIFVLDMGRPVKIRDLADDIALFYGKHIKENDIIYTGKRKGEKFSEKLSASTEKRIATSSPKIFRVEEEINTESLLSDIRHLQDCLDEQAEEKAKDFLFAMVKNK